ncbi:hypothetical protein HYV82_04920 [Candidatus Woesearchaeota archaeon]|nr:hypothetical protein [Candidatus Woesearchaeota archaeon]
MKRGAALALMIATAAVVVMAAMAAAETELAAQPAKASASVNCRDTGAVYISGFDDTPQAVYAKRLGSSKKFLVAGEWSKAEEFYHFASEEAIFLNSNKTAYTVYVGSRSYSVTCPAFVFSCRIINVSLDSCYKRGDQFTGALYAYNFKLGVNQSLRFEKPFLLTYKVITDGRKELVHGPEILSPEFRNISVSVVRKIGYNKFLLRWNTTRNITRFSAQYHECATDKYNFYDSAACSDKPACSADSECLEDESCEDGACIKLRCGECAYIENHACKQYECCGNSDCGEDSYCALNRCLKLACLEDEGITDHACQKLQCAPDEKAENGSCVKLQCAEDELAGGNKCSKLKCAENEKPQNHECMQLKCGFLQKAEKHGCVSIFSGLFRKGK